MINNSALAYAIYHWPIAFLSSINFVFLDDRLSKGIGGGMSSLLFSAFPRPIKVGINHIHSAFKLFSRAGLGSKGMTRIYSIGGNFTVPLAGITTSGKAEGKSGNYKLSHIHSYLKTRYIIVTQSLYEATKLKMR